MEEPLCLWWGGDEHGGAGLLHDGLAGGALPGVRRGRLLARRAQDPDLQTKPHPRGHTGDCRNARASGQPQAMEFQVRACAKGRRKFPWRCTLWPGDGRREEVQSNHSSSTDFVRISDLCKHTLVDHHCISSLLLTLIRPFTSFSFHVFSNLIRNAVVCEVQNLTLKHLIQTDTDPWTTGLFPQNHCQAKISGRKIPRRISTTVIKQQY